MWMIIRRNERIELVLRLVPVNGEKTKGEMKFAKELMPEMQPWAFPCKAESIDNQFS